jgi:hypothetical protein
VAAVDGARRGGADGGGTDGGGEAGDVAADDAHAASLLGTRTQNASLRRLHRVLSDVQRDAYTLQAQLDERSKASRPLKLELQSWCSSRGSSQRAEGVATLGDRHRPQ